MGSRDIKIGSLVRINLNLPHWEYLDEKHPLRCQGVVISKRLDRFYEIKFDGITAHLPACDIEKVS